jgi:AcrR family transcriptional regulator
VAKEASLSVGAIYLYFRSKEDLYVSLLEDTLELLSTELTAIVDSEGSDKLGRAWKFLCTWAQNDTEATRILRLCSQPNVRGQLSDEVTDAIRLGFQKVRGRLAAMVEAGESKSNGAAEASPESVADVIWALFVGLLQATDAKRNFELGGADLAELSQTGLAVLASSLAGAIASRVAA